MAKAAAPKIGAPLHEVEEVLTLLLYGPEGTGKTTAALTLAELGPVVLVNAEGGAKPTALRSRGVKIQNVTIWPEDGDASKITFNALESEVLEPMRLALREDPHAYAAVVIDSYTELARRLLDEVVANAQEKAARLGKAREQFQVDLADHGTLSQMLRLLLRRFRDLGIHLVITALERRDIDDDGFVAYGPALGPAVANDAAGMMDVVCSTSIVRVPDDENGEEFYIGAMRRTSRRRAKDRFGVMPPKMVDPTALRMVQYLDGTIDRSVDPRQLAIREALAAQAAQTPAQPEPDSKTDATENKDGDESDASTSSAAG